MTKWIFPTIAVLAAALLPLIRAIELLENGAR